jgi:hypothetical protein
VREKFWRTAMFHSWKMSSLPIIAFWTPIRR